MTDGQADGTEPAVGTGRQEPGRQAGRSGLLRSSAVMAAGTIVSRVTGFLRTSVLVIALGTRGLGDAYNVANTIPIIVYDLLLGGILTSVMVPLIVRARERDRRYGEEYEQRLFTLAVIGLAIITVATVLLAPVIIDLYAGRFTPEQRDLAIVFARFFLPQIFFFGVGAFAGAILNTRGVFGPNMWTPVLNNLVVTSVAIAFLVVTQTGVSPATITPAETRLLAMGSTAGIILQTVALWPFLRKIGFRWRLRFDFHRAELTEAGGMAAWTLLYVVVMQIGFLVNTNLSTAAGARGIAEGIPYGVGYTAYFNAYQLFQLPYAIIGVSVITALLPRMSEHAAERRFDLLREDFSYGTRLAAVIIVPAAALLFALGAEVTELFFAHGNTSSADAAEIATVLQAFALALVPFSVYQLMLRVFYALHDTRTPALISIVNVSVSIALAVAGYQLLRTDQIIVGIALALGVSWLVGVVVSGLVLRTRIGRLDGRRIVVTHVKAAIAMLPGLVLVYVIHIVLDATLEPPVSSLVALLAGGAGAVVMYGLFARLIRLAEIETLYRTVIGRFRGGVSG